MVDLTNDSGVEDEEDVVDLTSPTQVRTLGATRGNSHTGCTRPLVSAVRTLDALASSPGFPLVLRQRKILRRLSTSGKPEDEAMDALSHSFLQFPYWMH